MESEEQPIVVPMYQTGMDKVMPVKDGRPPIPIPFKPVSITYGEPVDCSDILLDYRAGRRDETSTRILITSKIFGAIQALQLKQQQQSGAHHA